MKGAPAANTNDRATATKPAREMMACAATVAETARAMIALADEAAADVTSLRATAHGRPEVLALLDGLEALIKALRVFAVQVVEHEPRVDRDPFERSCDRHG